MTISWNDTEVSAIVEDYFDMLARELRGETYNKAQHRRELSSKLNNRSNGSIERKHQNISAILIELEMPYIDGYKPLKNYQRTMLPEAILDFLIAHPQLEQLIASDAELIPEMPSVDDILEALVSPPETYTPRSKRIVERQPLYAASRPVDYLKREAANTNLGKMGEEFVINFERARLIASGKESLVHDIEQVSVTQGDYAGYDIRSFEMDECVKFIEVKTTKYGIDTPFYVTANELQFSENHANQYFLYRVFQYRKGPKLFTLQGNFRDFADLSPISYLARV